MERAIDSCILEKGVGEIEHIYCIEACPTQEINYVAGKLKSREARPSCPVLVVGTSDHGIRGRPEVSSNPRSPGNKELLLDHGPEEIQLLCLCLFGGGRRRKVPRSLLRQE